MRYAALLSHFAHASDQSASKIENEWAGYASCMVGLPLSIIISPKRCVTYSSFSGSTPELINQPTNHAPSPRLTLLSSTISLHARSSARLALHSPSQAVVPLFLLRSPYEPCRQSPPCCPGQDLPSVRKPDDPTHACGDRRSRQLRKRKLHGQEI